MTSGRRFPPPWTIEDKNDACFIVRDHGGHALALRLFWKTSQGLWRYSALVLSLWGAAMRRREFISFIAGAAAWPLAARAQHQTLPVIGFLSPVPGGAEPPPLAAFMRGLAEEGYVEGKNLAIERRFTNFRPELMPGAVGDCSAQSESHFCSSSRGGCCGQERNEQHSHRWG